MGDPLQTLQTPEGRTLAYATWGDPDGFPIITLHGTPGNRLARWPDEELYRQLGVWVISHDRAGYSRSDRREGRCVADEVDDVRALVDALGIDRFGVTGGSGGGPHALACAALLPERVVRATCTVGVAPYGGAGLTHDAWLAGMDPENVKEFGWALEGEDVLRPELEKEKAAMAERVRADPTTVLGDVDLSEADQAALARPEVKQVMAEQILELAAFTVDGWIDDDLAFTKPWGFDVSAVSVPVLVQYGATDVLVPPAHGEWLAAHVPGCLVRIETDGGHLGGDPVEEITANTRWLRDGVVPDGAS